MISRVEVEGETILGETPRRSRKDLASEWEVMVAAAVSCMGCR